MVMVTKPMAAVVAAVLARLVLASDVQTQQDAVQYAGSTHQDVTEQYAGSTQQDVVEQYAGSVQQADQEAITSSAIDVSVEHDAVYSIPSSRGPICSGSGKAPSGTACPLKGDIATTGCKPDLPSYTTAGCVAPVDATCAVVTGTSWGCSFQGETSARGSYAASGSGYQQEDSDEITFPVQQSSTEGSSAKTAAQDSLQSQQGANEVTPCPTLHIADEVDTPCPTLHIRSDCETDLAVASSYSGKPTQQGASRSQGSYQSQSAQTSMTSTTSQTSTSSDNQASYETYAQTNQVDTTVKTSSTDLNQSNTSGGDGSTSKNEAQTTQTTDVVKDDQPRTGAISNGGADAIQSTQSRSADTGEYISASKPSKNTSSGESNANKAAIQYEEGGYNDGSQESVDFSASKPGRKIHGDKDAGRHGSHDVASKPDQGGKVGRPSQDDGSSESQDTATSYPGKGGKGSEDKTDNDSQDAQSSRSGKSIQSVKDDDSVDDAASSFSHGSKTLQEGSRQADDDTPAKKLHKNGDTGSQDIAASKPGKGGKNGGGDNFSDSNDVASRPNKGGKEVEHDDSQDDADLIPNKGHKGEHSESDSGDSVDTAASKPSKGGKPESYSTDSDDSAASKPSKGGKDGEPESDSSDSDDAAASKPTKGGKEVDGSDDSQDIEASKPTKGGKSGEQIDSSDSKGAKSKPSKGGSSGYTTASPTEAAPTEARMLANVDEWLAAFKRGF